jgi:hypothetical protein
MCHTFFRKTGNKSRVLAMKENNSEERLLKLKEIKRGAS